MVLLQWLASTLGNLLRIRHKKSLEANLGPVRKIGSTQVVVLVSRHVEECY